MSESTYWQRSNVPLPLSEIATVCKSFRREHLTDPQSAQRWFEFAKRFSQMQLSHSEVEQLGFQTFFALKNILAATLTYLSEETVRQNQTISSLQKEERVLRRDLDSLGKIEKENEEKEVKLKEQFQKLQKKEQDLSLRVDDSRASQDL